ncbi:MAG TPA: zinc ribbon domain-containing protein [Deltaproteobacteria bacterium]|nr:zinc ribbon domain-containing protein [Deltaproteobacteria bacterium]
MPIYEYRCIRCGSVSEYLVGVGKEDNDIIRCRDCGSNKLEKVISTANLSKGGHMISSQGGQTCCGREEQCESPPCSTGGVCRR